MSKNKNLIYALIAAMTMTAMPSQVFAQNMATSSQLIAETSSTLTTGSALAASTYCLFPEDKELIKTNLVKVEDGEITNGFSFSYKWKDEWFFEDNTLFNQDLCKTASIFSALAYYSSDIDFAVNDPGASKYSYELSDDVNDVEQTKGIMPVLESHGFENVEEFNLRKYYNDDHVTQFNIGHKKASNGTEEKEVITIAIRGTRGEMEWLSNIAMGEDKAFGSIEDWTEQLNHMGLDITATRMVQLVEQYIADNDIETENAAVFITGQSRGGGLANLLGKKMEDRNFNTYTYTFAAPNTTLEENAENMYPSILNIVNTGDLVPAIPSEQWGFKKYGRTINTEMNVLLKAKYAKVAGELYRSSATLDETVKALGKVMEDRNEGLEFNDIEKITVKKSFSSEEKRAEALASIPEVCLPYAQIELTEGKNLLGKKTYGYTMVQAPMYFIEAAGLSLAGTMSPAEFLTFEVAEAYKTAKTRLIVSGIAGLSDPHDMKTYILLAYSLQLKDVKMFNGEAEAELYIDIEE